MPLPMVGHTTEWSENKDDVLHMFYPIWYHMYNLKNVKNIHWGVLL